MRLAFVIAPGRRPRRADLLPLVAVALACTLGLGLGACGGSSGSKTLPTSSTNATRTTSASSTGTSPDHNNAVMNAALLRVSDLPSTWKDSGKSSASTSDQKEIEVAKTIPACHEFVRAVEQEGRQVKTSSHKFVDSTALLASQSEVSNDVVAWPTTADAKTAYHAYSASVMKSCLEALFRAIVAQQAAASGVKITISVENLAVPAVGDAAIAYEAGASVSFGATTQQLAFIIQIVRSGRYTVSYNATMYKEAPTDFGKNLVVRSIARLEATT